MFPSKFPIKSCPVCRASHPAGTPIEKRDGAWVPVKCSGSVSTAPAAPRASTYRRSSPRGRWTGCSCGSREDNPRASDCASCQHDY